MNINFISLQSADGYRIFNAAFCRSKSLITDFSSVVYDFIYKNEGVLIYYLPDHFINGHYELLPVFYDINLGQVAIKLNQLGEALKMQSPTNEMKQRRSVFFNYFDKNNTERVYNHIFK